MLCELEVNNIGTYVELITQIDAKQQYRMWFRGQSNYSWGLVPSVQLISRTQNENNPIS